MHMVASLLREPRNRQYRRLIAFALDWSDEFSLVTREELHVSRHHLEVMGGLDPFLARTARASRWPGTELHGGTAVVSFFRSDPAASPILQQAASALYQWQMPHLPEDLAFYRNGSCWFGSIAHESESFLYPARVSTKTLLTRVPGLKYEIRRVQGRLPYGADQGIVANSRVRPARRHPARASSSRGRTVS